MPSLVTKIINDDGTERSFGPILVDDAFATDLSGKLKPAEDQRQSDAEAKRTEELVQEQEERNAAALAHQKRREEEAAAGNDPDADVVEGGA